MDSSSTSSTSMMMMAVFQNTMATPLYSTAWTPNGVGTYAATCIFLIVLGAVMRGLLAAKTVQESRWLDRELNRRFVAVQGKLPAAEQVSSDSLAKRMTLTENGVEENVMVVGKKGLVARPWRLSVDPIRAVIDTIIAGVGYLLMLAVMTMNVGYFLSVLGGVFVGSMLVGRYTIAAEH
ncbi:Ctr copper transporter [Truncatella angustata]|uniref:Copper transport protein n=1 Tax=Truncatella angustata TaxID=152316 RepID=A0A9P8UD22_9PEZI|nr:Ctr copper transporter [Truncatella angustata]KAH6647000.1 Ctr copper transporter [Truncatella angustata]